MNLVKNPSDADFAGIADPVPVPAVASLAGAVVDPLFAAAPTEAAVGEFGAPLNFGAGVVPSATTPFDFLASEHNFKTIPKTRAPALATIAIADTKEQKK